MTLSKKEREAINLLLDTVEGYASNMERLISAYRDLTYMINVATGSNIAYTRAKRLAEKVLTWREV